MNYNCNSFLNYLLYNDFDKLVSIIFIVSVVRSVSNKKDRIDQIITFVE